MVAGWYNQVHKRALDIVNATQMGQGCFRLAYEDGGPSDRRLSNSLMQRSTRSELPKATGCATSRIRTHSLVTCLPHTVYCIETWPHEGKKAS